MARVVVAPAAVDDLERLIHSHSLPADTWERLKRSLRPLGDYPLLGAPLEGRWDGFRFLLGPWRWMLIVYAYDRDADVVAIVTVQDGRSSAAVTATK
jgi:plasmid stabilization system protein ParE